MALITKPDMEFIWASGGAIVEPSDVKKQTGWTPEVPPHQWENWIQNRQDNYLAHINQRGIPEWDGNTEYEAGGLSYAQGSDGKIYKSVAASGPASVVSNPTTDGSDTYWTVAFLTQASADARYLQILNNGSDVNDAATFRSNIGVVSATETQEGLIEIATALEAQNFTANKAIDGAKLASAFLGTNSSLLDNGYQKLPSGLIIQWGVSNFSFAGTGTLSVAVTYPIAFPNAPLNTYASSVSNLASGAWWSVSHAYTGPAGGITYAYSPGYLGVLPVNWLAIGY